MYVPSLNCSLFLNSPLLQILKSFLSLGGRKKCATFSRSFLDRNEFISATTVQRVPLPQVRTTAPLVTDDLHAASQSGWNVSDTRGNGGPGEEAGKHAPKDHALPGGILACLRPPASGLQTRKQSGTGGCKGFHHALYSWVKNKKSRSETNGHLWLFQIYTVFRRRDIILW